MATLTLRRMGEGGMNDQLGGGFCRYSVDEFWMIPHFEKMLYDNGSLLAVYAQAALATGDAFYAAHRRGHGAVGAARNALPQGAFYCSLDADSEGHEGKFYVWGRDEIAGALTADEFAVFAPYYRHRPTRELRGPLAPAGLRDPRGRRQIDRPHAGRGRNPAQERQREAPRHSRAARASGAR